MSILDSIQEAENKAEKVKQQAMEDVSLLLEESKIETNKQVEALFAAAQDKRKQIDANTKIVIANKSKEISKTNRDNDLSLEELAKQNTNAVVDFILEKVVQI